MLFARRGTIRLAVVVAVVALVVLAGCTTGTSTPGSETSTPGSETSTTGSTADPATTTGSATDPTTTTESTPDPATTTEDTPGTDPAYPPGVTPSGEVNVSKLVAAHAAVVNESGYRSRRTLVVDAVGNPMVSRTVTRTVAVPRDGYPYRFETDGQTDYPFHTGRWVTREFGLRFDDVRENPYRRTDATPAGPDPNLAGLAQRLAGADVRVTDVTGSGQDEWFVLEATDTGSLLFQNGTRRNVTTVDGWLKVDSSGRILAANVTIRDQYREERQGEEDYVDVDVVEYEYELLETGIDSVARPDWVDEAIRETSDNGTALDAPVD